MKKWNELHPRDWPTLPVWLKTIAEKIYRNTLTSMLLVRQRDKEWILVNDSFSVLVRVPRDSRRKNPPFELVESRLK